MQHGIDSHLTAASTAQSHCGTHSHMKREPGGEGGEVGVEHVQARCASSGCWGS